MPRSRGSRRATGSMTSPRRIWSSRRSSRTRPSSPRCGGRSTSARRPRRSSRATPRRSPSVGLAANVAPERRPQFVGMHFFSPVPVMPLVELIRSETTSDATVEAIRDPVGRARQAGHRLGRSAGLHRQPDPHAVPCRGDARPRGRASGPPRTSTPGPGSASITRWGRWPWPTSSGSTCALGIMRVLEDGLDLEHIRPPRTLVELVEAGHLGQKTGRGFFTYPRD